MEEKNCHICLDTGNGKVWIRQKENGDKWEAEVMSSDAGVNECIAGLADDNPDVVNVLTEEGEENLHCIVGPEFKICLVPAYGNVEIWIEKLAEHGDEEA